MSRSYSDLNFGVTFFGTQCRYNELPCRAAQRCRPSIAARLSIGKKLPWWR